MSDRVGRVKTLMLTILLYAVFTGLSALSGSVWDFYLYRLLTGLGVGGVFAASVTLVAETMPDNARPFALGLLQALSAIGNMVAALISIFLGYLEESGSIQSAWRARKSVLSAFARERAAAGENVPVVAHPSSRRRRRILPSAGR